LDQTIGEEDAQPPVALSLLHRQTNDPGLILPSAPAPICTKSLSTHSALVCKLSQGATESYSHLVDFALSEPAYPESSSNS